MANKAIKAALFSIVPILLPFLIYLVKGSVGDIWYFISPLIYGLEEIIVKAVSTYKKEYDHFEWALKPVGELLANTFAKIRERRNNGDG